MICLRLIQTVKMNSKDPLSDYLSNKLVTLAH